jgi:molybdopterin converting factor small subunit
MVAGQLTQEGPGFKRKEVTPGDISSVLAALDAAHPGIVDLVIGADGAPKRFVNIYVNGEDVRFGDGLQTVVADGDEVVMMPAICGGAN